MRLFPHKFESIRDLYVHELRDLYNSEIRLLQALPQMADAAKSVELKAVFLNHLIVTRVHAARLEAILQNLAEHPNGEKCQGMQGLIDEAFEYVNAAGPDEVRDAGLVGAAHRIEHYEMAGYSAARSLALRIGDETAADLMRSTLNEECEADEMLLSVAESIGVAEKRRTSQPVTPAFPSRSNSA